MPPKVLYDWAHPQQQVFVQVTKLLRKRAELDEQFRKYHLNMYIELAHQRRAIKQELAQALSANCLPSFQFEHWQRTIRWKFGDHPLCTVGSLSFGGRFNIGKNIEPTLFPPFSAFYAAADKDTALQEALGQVAAGGALDARELALANTDSIVTFSVSGQLEHVLDLRDELALRDFVSLIRNFTISSSLVAQAKRIPVTPPTEVKTAKQLRTSLLNPNWRHVAVLCDIPANSQIFGQIVAQSGIAGILYPSKLTNKDCLAIFPENFIGGASYIQLDDDPPSTLVGPSRLDATNWEACERTTEQVRQSPLRKTAI